MAESEYTSGRRFRVVHGFGAEVASEYEGQPPKRKHFTRANQHQVGELLSDEAIEAHLEAGNLVEVDGETGSILPRGDVATDEEKKAFLTTAPNAVQRGEAAIIPSEGR